MSAMQNSSGEPHEPLHGILAEYDNVTPLMEACIKVRDAGYTKWDAHTPFPVHGLDAAMGVKPTKLPWAILLAGLTGMGSALLMQWWMMAVDYPFRISGKPLFSLPAFIPVTFELTVLFMAFTCFFGCLGVNGLPKLFDPLFLSPRFKRATNDRFFIYIESKDPNFDADAVQALLRGTQTLGLEGIHHDEQGPDTWLPKGTVGIALTLGVISLVPFALFARARESTSLLPRLHLNPPAPIKDDMDHQYKFKPQSTNWFYSDNRAERAPPAGTMDITDEVVPTAFETGRDASGAYLNVIPTTLTTHEVLPTSVLMTEQAMKRGKERFEVYCATCHGDSGHGDGAVNHHAERLQEGTWVTPSNIHEERVRKLPHGDIFNTIKNGVRNMPGYGHLIPTADIWHIVMYVRALQLSQHAPLADVPSDVAPTLQ